MSNLSESERAIPPSFNYDSFGLPENVALNFHFNPHQTESDLPPAPELDRMIRQADIVIPEFAGDDSAKQNLQRVMQGDKKEYIRLRDGLTQREARSYTQALYSSFYASRTPSAVIDVSYHDPDRVAFDRVIDIMSAFTHLGSSHGDHIAAIPLVLKTFELIQARDQKILENLQPAIEDVVSRNPKLQAKQESEPLTIEVFYGSAHRSLFDAVVAKQSLAKTNGFKATMSPESIDGDTVEVLYARYLRDLPLNDVDFEIDFAYAAFNEEFRRLGIIPPNLSNKRFLELFLENIEGLDVTNFQKLFIDLGGKLLQQSTSTFDEATE